MTRSREPWLPDQDSAVSSQLSADARSSATILAMDGEILAASDGLSDLLGLPSSSLAGRNIRDFLEVQDTGAFETQFLAAIAAPDRSQRVQLRLRADGGMPKPVAVALMAEHDGTLASAIISAAFTEAGVANDRDGEQPGTDNRASLALVAAETAIWDHDLESQETFYSDMWRQIRGLAIDDPVPRTMDELLEFVHPDDRQTVLDRIHQQRQSNLNPTIFQYRYRHRLGHWIWIECRGSCIKWDRHNRPLRVLGTDNDITARKAWEESLDRMSRRLKLALEASKIGVFEADFDRGTAEWDDGMFRLYHLESQETVKIGGLWESMLHPDDMERVFRNVDHHVANLIPFSDEYRVILSDGKEHFIRTRTLPFIDSDGHRKMIGANWDVTADLALQRDLAQAKTLAEARNQELEDARKQIEYVALHDALTGLPNRRFMDRMILEIEAECKSSGSGFALLHIDLDRFKQINDIYGHHAGDALLQHVAKLLKESVLESDFVARIGGDEFLAIVGYDGSTEELRVTAERMIQNMRQPVVVNGIECRSSASIGIAHERGKNVDVGQMLLDADIALYQAKAQGRSRYEFYSANSRSRFANAQQTTEDILIALERGEFVPFYQLQFDAKTLAIAGVEALARWQHPSRGLLTPDKFLPIAEDLNIVSEIDHLIYRKAISDLDIWKAEGLNIPKCSVNVSSRRLRDPNLKQLLDIQPEKARWFSFELLESIFLDDLDEQIAENLAHLRQLGISIEIDDFGTGHASIMGLLRLRPSALKIDRQLTKTLDTSAEQRELVGSIISMGHSLGVKSIAEGVETERHAEVLRDLGCDTLQGFGLAIPTSCSDLIEFVRRFVASRSDVRHDRANFPEARPAKKTSLHRMGRGGGKRD